MIIIILSIPFLYYIWFLGIFSLLGGILILFSREKINDLILDLITIYENISISKIAEELCIKEPIVEKSIQKLMFEDAPITYNNITKEATYKVQHKKSSKSTHERYLGGVLSANFSIGEKKFLSSRGYGVYATNQRLFVLKPFSDFLTVKNKKINYHLLKRPLGWDKSEHAICELEKHKQYMFTKDNIEKIGLSVFNENLASLKIFGKDNKPFQMLISNKKVYIKLKELIKIFEINQ
ncbi:MAG: hypothetical protein NTW30_04365 [Candidatus Aenigmarchaeota archaeon]|nr:hypothetical protein [Candidatus Aenigmarchaeota archaeon]